MLQIAAGMDMWFFTAPTEFGPLQNEKYIKKKGFLKSTAPNQLFVKIC